MEDHYGTDDVTNAISNGRRRVLNWNFVTVFRNQDGIFGKRDDAAFLKATNHGILYRCTRVFIHYHHDIGDGRTASATHVPSGKILSNRVDVIDVAVRVRRNNAITNRLQRNLCALFLLENPGLGAFAIGNIGNGAFMGNDLPIVIDDRT